MRWQQLQYRITAALRRFFYGRNGADALAITLFAVSLVLSLVAQLARLPWLMLFYYAGMLACFFRMLSRNTEKRRRENAWFLSKVGAVSGAARRRRRVLRDSRDYKHLKCPACKQRLRVPRGRGKIEITCPKCGKQMIKKV